MCYADDDNVLDLLDVGISFAKNIQKKRILDEHILMRINYD